MTTGTVAALGLNERQLIAVAQVRSGGRVTNRGFRRRVKRTRQTRHSSRKAAKDMSQERANGARREAPRLTAKITVPCHSISFSRRGRVARNAPAGCGRPP